MHTNSGKGGHGKWLLALAVCLFACQSAFAQADRNGAAPSDHPPRKGNKTMLRGCLSSSSGPHPLAIATSEGLFLLTGQISGLEKYNEREISLEGTKGDPIPIEGFFEPFPSFVMNRLVQVFPRQVPELSASLTNRAAWKTETITKYGVKFAHPESMLGSEAPNPNLAPNFVTSLHTETVSTFIIPRETYAKANFLGGSFTIFVNRNVSNRPSCMQFGQLGREEPPVPYVVGNLSYSEATGGGAAMGTWDSEYYFHIFQNGLCYELAFQLDEFSAHTADTGCNIPLLSQGDELNLIKPLIAGVSFFPPTVPPVRESNPDSIPLVTAFTASSQTADGMANRGLITFSWSTQDADYVEFTYTCLDAVNAEEGGVSSVAISEGGPSRYCQNIPSFKTFSTGHFYHSPNSSVRTGFGYFNHDDPTSVLVTVTPFSHGKAYPASSKSLTIIINPYNPFERGVPTETRNLTLAYTPTANGTQSYQQGSTLTIAWTDARMQDPCVNLYLVQDNSAGGESYLLQINSKREIGCLKPASSGSYAWTVTSKYSGSGFRILARTPGGTSGTLGAPFNIVKPPASLPQ